VRKRGAALLPSRDAATANAFAFFIGKANNVRSEAVRREFASLFVAA
jgi:hypothetical protein